MLLESAGKNTKPQVSHIKDKPDQEVELCFARYGELSKAAHEKGSNPPAGLINLGLAKTVHYRDRTERLIHTFGEIGQLPALFSNYRRLFNWFSKLFSESQRESEQSDPKRMSAPLNCAGASSPFADAHQNRPDNILPRGSQTERINPTASTSRPTNVLRDQLLSDHKELKDSVAEFFSKMPNLSFPTMEPFRSPVNVGKAEQMQYVPPYEQQQTNPRIDVYKIRQRWNLSFDGNEPHNIHDFIFRIEQMAYDDAFPVNKLTKVLHLFLSKKAEDWYWVYKMDHINASWLEMKKAMLSFFSSYDFEEETREKILHKFQTNRESFSDYVLSVQKLNARLQDRFSEKELIHRLCQNMNPALKNVTLAHQNSINTIEQLRVLCNRYEKMWDQTGYDPRRFNETPLRRKPAINALESEFTNLTINNPSQRIHSENNESTYCNKKYNEEIAV